VNGWKKCTEGMAVATEFVQKWCYIGLAAVQYSDRLLFYRCYSGTVCCAVQRLIVVLLALQWHCMLCSRAMDAVLPVLQWHCLLCSRAIECCSTGATVALSAVQ
jgi:hypothetical protein